MSELSANFTEIYFVCFENHWILLDSILYPSSEIWRCVQIISLVLDNHSFSGGTGDIAAELLTVSWTLLSGILQPHSWKPHGLGLRAWGVWQPDKASKNKKVQTARSGIQGLRIYHLQRPASEKGRIRVSPPRVGRILNGMKWSGRYEERREWKGERNKGADRDNRCDITLTIREAG